MRDRGVLCLLLCAVAVCCVADRRRHDGDSRDRRHNDDDSDDEGEGRVWHLADYDAPSWKQKHHKWTPNGKSGKHQHHGGSKHNEHHSSDRGQWKGVTEREDRNRPYGQSEGSDHSQRDGQRRRDGNHWDRDSSWQHHHHNRHGDWSRQERRPENSEHHNRGRRPEPTPADHDHGRRPENSEDRSQGRRPEPTSEDYNREKRPEATSADVDAVDSEPAPAQPVAVADPGAWSEEQQPPPHQHAAAMARYIVHVSDWAAMATLSTRPATLGAPFANVFSVADGTRYRSTGVPYMYLTDWEMSVKDLRVNNSASLTMSLAQGDYCSQNDYDPESPLCAHVILSGAVRQMDPSETDYAFARDALFTRHPEMASWPVSHEWFVAMLEIKDVIVLDYFGGAITVTKEDYFAASPFTVDEGRSTNQV